MRWLHSITDAMDMNLSKLWDIVENRGAWCATIYKVAKSQTRLSDWTMIKQKQYCNISIKSFKMFHIKKKKPLSPEFSLSLHAPEERPCEDTARSWLSASQQESSSQKSTLTPPWPWSSSLQNSEEINFCCLNHPAWGTLWLAAWADYYTHFPHRQSRDTIRNHIMRLLWESSEEMCV